MPKTYIPQANTEAEDLHKYLTRYQAKLLSGSVTADQIAALTDLIACLINFIQKWPKPPPV